MRPPLKLTVAALVVVCMFACEQAKFECGKTGGQIASDNHAANTNAAKDNAHKEPAAGKVMAKPEAAPIAKAAVPAADKAPSAAAADVKGKVYGGGVTIAETVKISELLSRVDELEGKRVRVQGTVLDVCPKRGCWFEMASDAPGKHLRFKVRDGVMVFPLSAKGKFAVAEGVVRKIPLNLEQTKRMMAHEAAEYGKAFKPEEVTEPITLVRLDGTGAVIRDGQ
jgi:hypothetical protein